MDRKKSTITFLAIMIAGVFFLFNSNARAQTNPRLEILSVNSGSFPIIRVQFELYDDNGKFITDLRPGDVLIRENDEILNLQSLELLRPGVQFIAAINQGPELSNRYAGVSRYEAIRQRLEGWIEAQPEDSNDQFSLATNTGLQMIHSRDREEWRLAVAGLAQTDVLQERPSLVALTRAIDLATDPNPENTMRRVILFITPVIPAANLEALPNLVDRAVQQGIPIHVWLVASPAARNANPQVFESLEQIALETGGEFFLFTGPEELPDPDDELDPARYTYRAQYESRIKNSATHVIGIEVRSGSIQVRSSDKPVYLEVLPPNPIFLSPPYRIERKWVQSDPAEKAMLVPEYMVMRIVVEYPDGKPRDIKASRLYVDNVLVDQKLTEPFDLLTWPLGELADGRYILRAEVEDILGLRQSSIDVPVELIIEQPQTTGWWQTALSGDRPLVLGAVALAGLLLVMSVSFAGRGVVQAVLKRRAERLDPLTQPLPPPRERIRRPRPRPHVERMTWPRQAMAGFSSAPAWLVRLADNDGGVLAKNNNGDGGSPPASAIPLTGREVTIGSDVLKAQYNIDSATVSGLHARIVQVPEGGFRIFDAGSVAGTWVNFAPVPPTGVLLKHGDQIHLGRVVFSFELANPPTQPQPRIQPYQDQE